MNARPFLRLFSIAAGVAVAVVAIFALVLWLSDSPLLDRFLVSRETTQSRSCLVDRGPNAAGAQRASLTAAWILGVREGALADWLKQLRDGPELGKGADAKEWIEHAGKQAEATDAAAALLAAGLKVERPRKYAPTSRSAAINEFTTFVENAEQPTARGLAMNYASTACEVYKLGAYWGFSVLYRAGAPDRRNVFAPEIGHYARRLDLPKELTRAMTEASGAGKTSAQVQAEDEQLSRRIAEYWSKR